MREYTKKLKKLIRIKKKNNSQIIIKFQKINQFLP